MTKVSIIVPIYNVEKYLRECLDSLVNQTLKDIEIICVDDGSTDNSGKILDEYAVRDNRIKVIHKENGGYGKAMNVGLDNATGECIGIVESDDFADIHMFEDLYNLIEKNNCDFIKSDYYSYYTKSNKNFKTNIFKNYKVNIVTNLSEDKTMLFINPCIWSALYKKDFLLKNNIRFLETPGASYQDTSFNHKVFLLAERLMLVDSAYIHYRRDNENSSVHNKGKIYCVADEYKEVHKLIENKPELKQYVEYLCATQYNGYYWNLSRLSMDLKEEFFNYFYTEFKSYYENGLLGKTFFGLVSKNARLLIDSPQKYYKKYIKKTKYEKWNNFRKNIIRIHINTKELKFEIFGKTIIDKEF